MVFEAIQFVSFLLDAWKTKIYIITQMYISRCETGPLHEGENGRVRLLESRRRGKYVVFASKTEYQEKGENYTLGYVLGNVAW